jgi:hypothetical protein
VVANWGSVAPPLGYDDLSVAISVFFARHVRSTEAAAGGIKSSTANRTARTPNRFVVNLGAEKYLRPKGLASNRLNPHLSKQPRRGSKSWKGLRMNVAYTGPWPTIAMHDALLMDVARRIQLSKTKHTTAEQNFRALCQHVDRQGSPLEGKVIECYPSGSFATGTAIVSRVAENQHDVDVVIELDASPSSPPRDMLRMLFDAINGDPGSRYHGMVRQNSRCVTVIYEDGTAVDLMPVARIAGPDRAAHLFHYKQESGEAYHKPVNPWGWAKHFNDRIEFDREFYELFKGRQILAEDSTLRKAETQPLPEHVPLEEKSPRAVAIQLLKRNRDVAFRAKDRQRLRKPPSVIIARFALDSGPVSTSLTDEVINVANSIRTRLQETDGPRGSVHVENPAYPPDVFSDRWPENTSTQGIYDTDLRRLIVALYRLRNDNLSLPDKLLLLKGLFGETAATYAIDSQLEVQRKEMDSGRLHMGNKGKVLGAIAAPAVIGSRTTPTRAATREGGGSLSE